MTPMRWVYAAFWIIVITMILLQFQNYNKHIDQVVAAAGPKQQHFFFLNGATNAATTEDAPAKPDGADVRQISFVCADDTPAPGSLTCHVTVKNYGNMKATDIQILVSPYRGSLQQDSNGGRVMPGQTQSGIISDSNPIAQVSQLVTVPDLAPNETATVDAVFASQQGYSPGDNLDPQITFRSVKPTSAPAPAH